MTSNGPNPRNFIPWDGRELPNTHLVYRVIVTDRHYRVEVKTKLLWFDFWDPIGLASSPDAVTSLIKYHDSTYASKVIAVTKNF